MKLFKIIGVTCLGLVSLPMLLAQPRVPEGQKVADIVAKWRKDSLNSQDVEGRRRAMEGFLYMSEDVSRLVDSLRRGIRDNDDQIRTNAAKGLNRVGTSARAAMDDLVGVLEHDKVPAVRVDAAAALGGIFRHGQFTKYEKKAVRALIKAMREDNDTLVRRVACSAFRTIGEGAWDAAPALLEVIKDKEDLSMRERACGSLVYVACPEAKVIVPDLLEMYKNAPDSDRDAKGIFLVALGKIGDKEEVVIPLFIDVLKDPRKLELRVSAAQGIEHLGPKAKAAVPALIMALDVSQFKNRDHAESTQYVVLTALASIGPDAKEAIPAIRSIALTSPARLNRTRAEKALKAIQTQ